MVVRVGIEVDCIRAVDALCMVSLALCDGMTVPVMGLDMSVGPGSDVSATSENEELDFVNVYMADSEKTVVEECPHSVVPLDRPTLISREVRWLIQKLLDQGTFSPGYLKRQIRAYLLQHPELVPKDLYIGMNKPSGMNISEMYDKDVYVPGEVPLTSGSHPFKLEAVASMHMAACQLCRRGGKVSEECYFFNMWQCLRCGWKPPVEADKIVTLYEVDGNYKSVDLYSESFDKEWKKTVKHGVVEPVPRGAVGVLTPMGAVVKGSDKLKAEVLTGVKVCDQASMNQANEVFQGKGLPEIKARMSTDATATGVNSALQKKPFRYPGPQDALKLIKRGDWIALGDVSRYFYSFPLALASLFLFFIEYKEIMYRFTRCPFGFALCPYYCQGWSAEFLSWVRAKDVSACVVVDDWFTSGSTEEEADKNLDTISDMLVNVGLEMAEDKRQCGKQVVYLGILIDTDRMVMTFDRVTAQGFGLQLNEYLIMLVSGKHVNHTIIRHVCGKLNWYSEVLQSGRLRTRSWWIYEKYGVNLLPDTKAKLISDTQWWVIRLRMWSEGELGGGEYPILSSSELQSTPGLIYIVQSDMSGPDGYGYIHGDANNDDPKYVSKSWKGDYTPSNSHCGELYALLDFCRNINIDNRLLVWVTDSLSAVWSVNKGRCIDEEGLCILSSIFEICDDRCVQTVALWVPRERNLLADYLSHLAASLNREEVSGWARDLGKGPELGDELQKEKLQDSYSKKSDALRSLVLTDSDITVASDIQEHRRVHHRSRGKKQWLHKVIR